MERLVWEDLSAEERQTALSRPAVEEQENLAERVSELISLVKKDKDKALIQLTEHFDNVSLESLSISDDVLKQIANQTALPTRNAIDASYQRVRAFHLAQRRQNIDLDTAPGVNAQVRYSAINSVGLYIPGGTAPLPSTVLMLGIPAQIAGCQQVVLCTPPTQDGSVLPEIAYAAILCGINTVYTVGGVQSIAAMAYGTETIPKVLKIFGPGNAYVTEAKKQVSQQAQGAAIDMPAGPSEVLVIADSSADPEFIAADLLSQAEHGVDSQTLLVTDDDIIIEQTKQALQQQLQQLERKHIAQEALKNSRLILTSDMTQACDVSNRYGPEHLIVQTESPEELLNDLDNASSIFLGHYCPESAGDYTSGTNHVLPTYGYSKMYNSLGLEDFQKRYTVQSITKEGLSNIASDICRLAEAEGLDAHKRAVTIRVGEQ